MKQMNYRIVAKCNPYHSNFHYNGQKVVKYDGATPIEWVIEDGMAEDEAKARLMSLAQSSRAYDEGSWVWEDEETVDAAKEKASEEFDEDHNEEYLTAWFKGRGIYDDLKPVLLEGETSFRDDTMTYMVEAY